MSQMTSPNFTAWPKESHRVSGSRRHGACSCPTASVPKCHRWHRQTLLLGRRNPILCQVPVDTAHAAAQRLVFRNVTDGIAKLYCLAEGIPSCVRFPSTCSCPTTSVPKCHRWHRQTLLLGRRNPILCQVPVDTTHAAAQRLVFRNVTDGIAKLYCSAEGIPSCVRFPSTRRMQLPND
ncbi:hypothetical protein MTO96_009568 [Rhipicephalus appendiculatus]